MEQIKREGKWSANFGRVMPKRECDNTVLALSNRLHDRCKVIANELGCSWTEFARLCIIEGIRKYNNEKSLDIMEGLRQTAIEKKADVDGEQNG